MIQAVKQTDEDLVEIQFDPRPDYVACQVAYSLDGAPWVWASLYPDLVPETVLNGCDFLWEQAQTQGTLRLQGRENLCCYWNPYLNVAFATGSVRLKVSFLTEAGCYEDEATIELKPPRCVYLYDWNAYAGAADDADIMKSSRWDVIPGPVGTMVGLKAKRGVPPLLVPLPVRGRYQIIFGVARGGLRCLAKLGDEPYARIMANGSRYQGAPEGKANVELVWQEAELGPDYSLELSQLKETVEGHESFGWLSYIKLVPCTTIDRSESVREEGNSAVVGVDANQNACADAGVDAKASAPAPANASALPTEGLLHDLDVILYYEPYSYALHGIHTPEQLNGIMLEEFLRARPQEIACSTVRVGMKAMHRSRFLETVDTAAVTDDNTTTSDPVKLAASGDVLAETICYASGRDVRLTACVGMNRPYLWNPVLSERFTREHPSYVVDGDFDYRVPEVRGYALRILEELVCDYDTDGLVLDYMRHYRNQTVDTLVEVIRGARRLLTERARRDGRRRELKVRVPADQLHYYDALRICVATGDVDGIIPSNLLTTLPLPPVEHYVALCRGTGVRVYGCIDGWKWKSASNPRSGAMTLHHTPQDVRDAVRSYRERGVGGIFFYQGDQFTGNPYLEKLFH